MGESVDFTVHPHAVTTVPTQNSLTFPSFVRSIRHTVASEKNEKKLARSFNFIYPIELEIKDTTDTAKFASYLGLHLRIDNDGQLRTKFYDKRVDFKFLIVKFLFICSNILAAPENEVYISQLSRYSRTCGSYHDFLDRWLLLTRKLSYTGFLVVKLLHGLARVVRIRMKYLVLL